MATRKTKRQRHLPLYPKPGATIRAWRTKKGWTQQQLADELTCSRPHVAQIERGETLITIVRLADLAEVFGLTNKQVTELMCAFRDQHWGRR